MPKIVLKDKTPIAKGCIRAVYRHPSDPRLLIKVVHRSALEQAFGKGRPWYKFGVRRYKHLIGYLREVREQFALQALQPTHPDYLQKIVGFAETDLGPGLVVEAVFAPDGSYAPTLAALIEQGPLSPKLQEAFDSFCEALVESPVILAEVNIHNVVYGTTDGGDEHFVLIDGIGHKTLIPLEVMSDRIKRMTSARKIRNLRQRVVANGYLRGGNIFASKPLSESSDRQRPLKASA